MAKNISSKFDISDGFSFGVEEKTPVETVVHKEDVKKEEKKSTVSDTEEDVKVENILISKYKRVNNHREIGSTQGRKGESLHKTSMRFSDDNWEYLNKRSRQLGLNNTEYINMLLDKDRLENGEI